MLSGKRPSDIRGEVAQAALGTMKPEKNTRREIRGEFRRVFFFFPGDAAVPCRSNLRETPAFRSLGRVKNRIAPLVIGASLVNPAAADEVVARRDGPRIVVMAGEREVLVYQAEPGPPREGLPKDFLRGGYISMLRTPAGIEVTDDYPPDLPHHHGFWSAWTKTEFRGRSPDFWNMGDGSGRVEFAGIEGIENEDGVARLVAKHRFVDLSVKPAVTVLEETWRIEVRATADMHRVDVVSTQSCATDSPLLLPEHRYGGFGFRGRRDWAGVEGCRFLGASGRSERAEVEGSRERWCWVGGAVEGRTAGIYLLCHPSNFRFPQPVRAHPEMPFFCYSPPKAGDMEIRPGVSFVSRYRLVPADGEPDAAQAERWWKEYAGPAEP